MRHVLLLLVLSITLSGTAHAGGGIVLESYTNERPADANRLLAPILEELSARGYSAGDTLARTYDAQVSRPPQTTGGLPPDFTSLIDRGFKAWVAGRFDEAIQTLSPLVEKAHANPGAFAKDQSLREPLLKGLIALALSHQRNGDPSAMRSTFIEILRSYPDTQLSRGTYGPEAAEAFEQVRKEILAAGKGKLSVKVSDESASVYINERLYGTGSTTAELVPGEYRVCAMLGSEPSRNHRVTVRASGEASVVIDVKQDQALRTTGYTGFMFASSAERELREAPWAARFANLIGANAVAVIGIDDVHGRPSIVGSLISLQNGREIRRASIATDPDPSTDLLRALARYLAGDQPAAGLEVEVRSSTAQKGQELGVTKQDKVESARPGYYKWAAAGVGGAAVITGGVLIWLDGNCKGDTQPGVPCTSLYSTMVPGVITLGAGLALGGVSAYLFATDHKAPAKTAFLVPTQGGAFAGFATSW